MYSLICLQFWSRTAARSPATEAVPLRKASTVAAWTSRQPIFAHWSCFLQLKRKIEKKIMDIGLTTVDLCQVHKLRWQLVGTNSLAPSLSDTLKTVVTLPHSCFNETSDYFTGCYDFSADRLLKSLCSRWKRKRESTHFLPVSLHWTLLQSTGEEGESLTEHDLSSPVLNWQLPVFSLDTISECMLTPTLLLHE